MEAKYWIAQHIDDLFRNEPKNVGVFVMVGDQVSAKFLGESESNKIDGRGLKGFSNPNVYRQWIEYWRRVLVTKKLDEIVKTSGSHYRVFEGGSVTDIDSDSPEDVAKFLFTSLVTESYAEATSDEIVDIQSNFIPLDTELTNAFKDLSLMTDSVKHPIRRNAIIQGKKVIHKPTFTQENGRLYVIETIDFTLTQKVRSRDHAGYSAYMFNDIRQNRVDAETISVIKVRDEDREIEEVRNGLTILKNESSIVDWFDKKSRTDFIESRREVAFM